MENHDKDIKKLIDESTTWFSTQRLPDFFPAFVARISDEIKNLNIAITNSSEATNQLSQRIYFISLIAVIISLFAIGWDIYKTLFK